MGEKKGQKLLRRSISLRIQEMAHPLRSLSILVVLILLTGCEFASYSQVLPSTEIAEIRWTSRIGASQCVVEFTEDTPRITFENRMSDLKVLYCDLWGIESAPNTGVKPINDSLIRSYQTVYFPSEKRLRLALKILRPLRVKASTWSEPERLILDLTAQPDSSPTPKKESAAPSENIPVENTKATPSLSKAIQPPFKYSSVGSAPIQYKTAGSNGSDSPTQSSSSPVKPLASPPLPSSRSNRRPMIVIDPGHGGWHKGAVEKFGKTLLEEKALTMSMALKLKAKIEAFGKYDVCMTRSPNSDVYIGLYDRAQFAERRQGDLFVSIHCNSVDSSSARDRARGLELWYWNKNGSTSAAAKHLEQLENDEGPGTGLSEAGPAARRLLSSLMADQLEAEALQSRKACEIFNEVFLRQKYFRTYNRGIHSARFKVLENYQMPAVLIEVGFLSHPTEGRLLADSQFQDMATECMAQGVDAVIRRNLNGDAPSPTAAVQTTSKR